MGHSPGAVLNSVSAFSEAPETLVRYAVDGIVPRAVLLPSSEAEIASALCAAAAEGAVVVPWGGGTQQDLGHPIARADFVLSLERLDQMVEYVPSDMTITVQPGVRLAALQALTASHGQTFPLDPPRATQATIGGIVATAASGPRRMAYGGVRDLVLGVRLALADGRVIQAGGKVVKNVAGYDMPKLVVGSLGTLGIVTEVSLRLRPLPDDSRTLLFGFADSGSAIAAAESILNSELLPAAVAILSPAAARRLEAPGAASLAVALEETVENNGYQAERLSRMMQPPEVLTREAQSDFWDRLVNFGDRFGSTFRLRVNTVLGDLAEHLEAPDLEGIAYAAGGTVILYGMADGVAAVDTVRSHMARAGAAGGSAVLESGPIELRRQVEVWGSARPEWKFTHSIRRTFDPALVLNRGRYVGGI